VRYVYRYRFFTGEWQMAMPSSLSPNTTFLIDRSAWIYGTGSTQPYHAVDRHPHTTATGPLRQVIDKQFHGLPML
jgi:hypothetical protein